MTPQTLALIWLGCGLAASFLAWRALTPDRSAFFSLDLSEHAGAIATGAIAFAVITLLGVLS